MGYAGLLTIAHAAFYGIGAYTAALMSLHLQTSFLFNLLCAIIINGFLGALISIPSLRIRDEYFVITTFAFQIVVFNILNNWIAVTGGPMGLPSIPAPTILGIDISSRLSYFMLVILICSVVFLFYRRIIYSPFGRVLEAIREDEIIAQAYGKNIAYYKMLVFIVGSSIAAVPGVIYAHYISFIDPTSFTITESIAIITIVIIGGSGSLLGPLVGATVLIALPEFLRLVSMPPIVAANLRQILYGVLLVTFILLRPQGLLGKYTFYSTAPRK